jgi:hypothetical protein
MDIHWRSVKMKTGSLILAGLAYLAASTVSAQEHWLQQEIRTNSVHQLPDA